MTEAKLISVTVRATVEPTDREDAVSGLRSVSAARFPDGGVVTDSTLESLDTDSLTTAQFQWTDSPTGGQDSPETDEPNAFSVDYEDNSIVFRFSATESIAREFGTILEECRTHAGVPLWMPVFECEYQFETLLDPTAEAIRTHPVLPDDADIAVHRDHTAGTTRVRIESAGAMPFEQVDQLLPGLITQYHDIAAHIGSFELQESDESV